MIAKVTGIPIIDDPCYPFPNLEFLSKAVMSKVFTSVGSYKHWHFCQNVLSIGKLAHPVKLLARIIMHNIYPIDLHSDLGLP